MWWMGTMWKPSARPSRMQLSLTLVATQRLFVLHGRHLSGLCVQALRMPRTGMGSPWETRQRRPLRPSRSR
ncbi:unnamed protein product, partial [Ixodes pacificus]